MSQRRFHVVLDCHDVETEFLDNIEFLHSFIEDVCQRIGMNILVKPTSVVGTPENPGVTAFAIIDFSHISIHTFTNTKEFCLDVFSCKQFDYKKLYDFVKYTLQLDDSKIKRAVVKYNGRPAIDKHVKEDI